MSDAKSGHLHTALATWIFLVNDRGSRPDDDALCAALDDLCAADPDADHDALGQALVELVASRVAADAPAPDIAAWLGRLFGDEHIDTDMGPDREERIRRARRYQFNVGLPWLARIIDRFPDGTVDAHWLLVERIDERITCMDPFPWDDLDEEYTQPVVDFMVKWELAGAEGLRWRP